jgi:transposase
VGALLDLAPGRSATALETWMQARYQSLRDRVRVMTMDGFGGYERARQ